MVYYKIVLPYTDHSRTVCAVHPSAPWPPDSLDWDEVQMLVKWMDSALYTGQMRGCRCPGRCVGGLAESIQLINKQYEITAVP